MAYLSERLSRPHTASSRASPSPSFGFSPGLPREGPSCFHVGRFLSGPLASLAGTKQDRNEDLFALTIPGL